MATEGEVSSAAAGDVGGDLHLGITFRREELIDSLAERVFDRMRHSRNSDFDSIETTVREKVEAMIQIRLAEVAGDITREAVMAQVGTLLAEGWEVTENYGAKTKRVTVRELVIGWLTSQISERESYHDRGKNRLDVIAQDMVKKALESDLSKEIEALKQKVRAMLQANVDKSLRQVFMDAIGAKG